MNYVNDMVSPFNNPLIRFIAEPAYRWLRHTIFILVGLLLAFKEETGLFNSLRPAGLQRAILLQDGLLFIFIMGIIYFIILFLIPRLLFRSRVFLFALSLSVIISLIYFVVWALDYFLVVPEDTTNGVMRHVELSVISFIQMGAVSSVVLVSVIGLVVFKKWVDDLQRMNELQQDNLTTELAQLKSQINPHFLFNTLNNLFVLTKTDTEKAGQVLLGLSDLLRYQLYESAKEKILLSKDINFIQNLLALEKIRKNDFEYLIETTGDIDGVMLPPFLFIPFVENAIKHGASTVGHCYLKLNFRIIENHLYFNSENSKPPSGQHLTGGIGLNNIKRRLELLYPGSHTLELTDGIDIYKVNLTIPI